MKNPNNTHIDKNDSAIGPQGAAAAETGRAIKQMGRAVKKNLNRQIQFMLNSCVNCGVCAESCHYYCATGDSDLIPANKFKKVHNMMHIAQRMLDAREMLQTKRIALAPCGHGYRVMRWEVEKHLGKPFRFPPVQTIVELIDRYLRQGRIILKKDAFEGPMTYHDPCNIARRGGVLQEPRNILKALTSTFVEMQPQGARNYCCGGGGGLASTGDYGQLRITMGKKKAEQIRQTGAKVVATNCFNCMTQIRDLNKAYELNIEVKSIVELVAESLDPNVATLGS